MVEVEDEPGVHRDLPRLVAIGSQLDRPPLAAGDLHRPVRPQVAPVREAVGLPALIAAPFTVTGRTCGLPRCVLPASLDLRAGVGRRRHRAPPSMVSRYSAARVMSHRPKASS